MNQRRRLILLSILSLLALFAMASGLRGLDFQPGRSAFREQAGGPPVNLRLSVEDIATGIESIPLWQRILFWAGLLLNVWLMGRILTPEQRRRLLLRFIRFTLLAWGLLYLIAHDYIHIPDILLGFTAQAGEALPGQGRGLDGPSFRPPQIAAWITYLISLGVVLGLLALAWFLARRLARSRAGFSAGPLEEIGQIARSSLDGLSAGGDWENLILQSYARMAQAVAERRKLQREEAMTPREFAVRLERAGLPRSAVQRLTALFESARYGTHASSPAEVSEAVACLTSILQYCGEAA